MLSRHRGCSISCLQTNVGCDHGRPGPPAGDPEINTEWNNHITTIWICFKLKGFLRERNFDVQCL